MSKLKCTVAFVAIGVSPEVLERNEFYRQDINILNKIGCDVRIINRLSQSLRGIDLAFVWWWSWLWYIGPILRKRRVPIIATGTLDPLEYDRRPFYKKGLLRFGCRYPDANVFVSEYIRNGLAKRFHIPRVEVCPHIVTNDYCPSGGVGRLRHTIFSVAWKKRENLVRKMQPELINAFAVASARLPELRLMLAGHPMDGEILLRQQCAALGISDRVDFLGPISRSEKIGLMRSCGQYYQCSRSEGFGVAIAEAMACGAPVVVNRNTAIPEVVGECGHYVRDETPLAIADSFVELAGDRGYAERIGQSAAERVDLCFREPVRLNYFEQLIRRLVRGERRG